MSRALHEYSRQLVSPTRAGPIWKLNKKDNLHESALNGFKCEPTRQPFNCLLELRSLCCCRDSCSARLVLIIRAGVDASTVTSQQAERISELFHTYAHDG